MVLIRIVNRFIIILSLLLLLLLITRYYNYLIRYLNYYPLKCREPRENGSREGVRRMGEGGEKREKGKGEKKGDLIRERRAFFPEIRVGVLDPSSVHDCIYTIASLSPLFLSFHTRGSTGLIRAHLAAPSSNLLLESSSRTEAYHHPLWKKKRKGTHGQLISQRSIREQSDSSGSHRHQLPTFPDSRREIRSRNISSFGSSRCYLLHPTWRPPLVPLRIISHGREPLSPPMILDR